eukprot:10337962-Alexandrium_andersonii.AAC.1
MATLVQPAVACDAKAFQLNQPAVQGASRRDETGVQPNSFLPRGAGRDAEGVAPTRRRQPQPPIASAD